MLGFGREGIAANLLTSIFRKAFFPLVLFFISSYDRKYILLVVELFDSFHIFTKHKYTPLK